MIQQVLFFSWILSSTTLTSAFSPLSLKPTSIQTTTDGNGFAKTTELCMAVTRKKKKPSMAERRQRRKKKSLGGPNPYANLPSPDFSTYDDEKEESEKPIHVPNPEAAAEKAKELLKAQRDSVNMLTLVKERIVDRLSDAGARETLQENGFVIIDGLFGDTSNNNDDVNDEKSVGVPILGQLLKEGETMLEKGGMEVDTVNLGKGQYVVPIQGGEKQYASCPRMVEIVVSATKHVPEAFGKREDDSESNLCTLDLDAAASMATLRTFDRKALKASLSLLTGTDDDAALDVPQEEIPLAVIKEGEDDKRKLSLHYYIVHDTWTDQCGGGLEFEGGARANAKQDRLVVFYSDSTKCKAIPWKGSDESSELMVGSSIELHLIEKRK